MEGTETKVTLNERNDMSISNSPLETPSETDASIPTALQEIADALSEKHQSGAVTVAEAIELAGKYIAESIDGLAKAIKYHADKTSYVE